MKKLLNVLLVEDSEDDSLLTLRALKPADYEVVHQRVDSANALREAIAAKAWDVVLSDYSMPHFSGADALRIVKEHAPEVPFIVVSGAIGEQRAVEIMKSGAADYVMKDNLARLPLAVERELREAEDRRARKQAEAQVQKLSRALEQSASVVVITDTSGVIEYINPAFTRVTGYTPDEVIGEHSRMLQSGLTPQDVYQDMWKTILAGDTWRAELQNKRKNGELYWVETTISAIKDPEGKLIQFLAVQEDITAQLEAKQALSESEARFKALIANSSDIITVLDQEGTITFESQSVRRALGYEAGGRVGESIFTFIHPEDMVEIRDVLADLSRLPRSETVVECRVRHADGSWIHIESHATNLLDDPLVRGVVVNSRDVTERVQAEQALRESEEKFRTIFELAPYAIIIQQKGGVLMDVNQAFLDLVGIPDPHIQGKNIWDLDIFAVPSVVEAIVDELTQIKRITNRELTVKALDGRMSSVLVSSQEVELAGETVVLSIAVDITERKQAEAALKRNEALLRALLDATTNVAFLMARDGTYLTLNRTLADSYGTTVEAMIGKDGFALVKPGLREARYQHFEEAVKTGQAIRWEDASEDSWWDNNVYPVLSPSGGVEAFAVYSRNITEEKRLTAELERYTTQLEQMVEERTAEVSRAKQQIETILNNAQDAMALVQVNGDIQTRNPAFVAMFGDQVSRWLEYILQTVINPEQSDAVSHALLNVVRDRQRQRVEAQITTKDGSERDIDLSLIPVRSETDEPIILVSAHDITHLKEIERFKARFIEDALHDLATPISGLSTRLYLLKRSPEQLGDHVRALENQVVHLRNLLADLRTLSQLDRQQLSVTLEPCDLNELAMRVYDTYEPVAIEKEQTLELVTDPGLPKTTVDPRLIERVYVNLVSNAINYTPSGKSIRVRTQVEGDNIAFSVADEGIGISADDLPRVFERFYRTSLARKTQSSGTGLGLAIVKEIVELHGGTVTVTSTLGMGSMFTIRLPISANGSVQ